MLEWLVRSKRPSVRKELGHGSARSLGRRPVTSNAEGRPIIDLQEVSKAYETDAGPFLAL